MRWGAALLAAAALHAQTVQLRPLHVSAQGSILDDAGKPVLLRGVNRSGTGSGNAEGGVTGSYYSDKDGQKYDVQGKIGTPQHAIEFRIRFPRVEHTFKGMLFTGDGKAMAGASRLAEREAAFYAVRSEK